jgi:hypothetical protein
VLDKLNTVAAVLQRIDAEK